jgi:hypothetical protein
MEYFAYIAFFYQIPIYDRNVMNRRRPPVPAPPDAEKIFFTARAIIFSTHLPDMLKSGTMHSGQTGD